MAYSVPNTLNRFISRGKDKIKFMSQSECVYKIVCSDCDASYVEQTKRQLAIRIKEHKGDINKKNDSLSVISNHRLEKNHEFDWSETRILDRESSYNKRLVLEMVFIKTQKNELNKQSDTDLLSDAYLDQFPFPFLIVLPLLGFVSPLPCPCNNLLVCSFVHLNLDRRTVYYVNKNTLIKNCDRIC